ncbi:Glycoside hydrolase, 17 [Brettanomyces nanus]|uniref:Glycoside hydrolase, 17 n=1 Tax=Eeniella nana TaxID=13502 RepID=A0A875S9B2_EENNA|nr:Glycoside hydrolase, 17 [Brettanomyces nanus]QPG76745.1 Glycoside hydrolase, 17 [Brettanomyces nanus]
MISVASPLPHAHHQHKRSVATNIGTRGITYSPYSSTGDCKTTSEVASDVAELADYDLIRLYGVDCNQVANVFSAKADGQKLFLGIYYVSDIQGAVDTISSAVDGVWDDIDTVSVGNELVNSGEATVDQISGYIDTARTALTAAGYTGSVVSVDTHVAILANTGLCDLSDYIAFNAHAYWDGNTLPEDAGKWLLGNMQAVSSACGGKRVMCVESGWPTQGDDDGVAVPSTANQKTALSSIADVCGNDTIAFNAFNDLWKDPGTYGVEQYWGIY